MTSTQKSKTGFGLPCVGCGLTHGVCVCDIIKRKKKLSLDLEDLINEWIELQGKLKGGKL